MRQYRRIDANNSEFSKRGSVQGGLDGIIRHTSEYNNSIAGALAPGRALIATSDDENTPRNVELR